MIQQWRWNVFKSFGSVKQAQNSEKDEQVSDLAIFFVNRQTIKLQNWDKGSESKKKND